MIQDSTENKTYGTVNKPKISPPMRRHRLNGFEIEPVKESVRTRLIELLESRKRKTEAEVLFRVWYRLETHCTNRPNYPEFSWSTLRFYIRPETVPLPYLTRGS